MNKIRPFFLISRSPFLIWFVGVSFVLFQFFLQLSSGIVIGQIMSELGWSAFRAGILSSAFYYVYTTLQIPVGLLFDIKSSRVLLSINAVVCALGCFIFAFSDSFPMFMMGRLLMGAGAAFAFVGLARLLSLHFPPRHFAFMIGLSETLGFCATVLGMIGMGAFIKIYGWQQFIVYAGYVGILIGFLCAFVIPKNDTPKHKIELHVGKIFKSMVHWANGLYVGLSFSVITVFGALWCVPFLQIKLGCNIREASLVGAMIFLGTGLSCPLFGFLSQIYSRRSVMVFSNLLTSAIIVIILWMPNQNQILHGLLLFLAGLSCGAYMLAYTISNEISPENLRSTGTGFTNTLAMLSAPILQPLIGALLDIGVSDSPLNLIHYQWALLVIPLALILACGFVFYLPESAKK